MIAKIALFLVVAALTASAQSSFDVLECRNASYTNVTIIRTNPAYIVVSHGGGVAKVAMTNLTPQMQKQLGYDPKKGADSVVAEEKALLETAKLKAELAKRAAALRGTNRVIQVVSVLDELGRCQTSMGLVYLTSLPASVTEYANRYNNLKNLAVMYSEQMKELTKANQRASLNSNFELCNKLYAAKLDAQDSLEKITPSRDAMKKGLVKNTSVVAYPTGTKYGGLPLWQCVGVAP